MHFFFTIDKFIAKKLDMRFSGQIIAQNTYYTIISQNYILRFSTGEIETTPG